MIDKNDAPEGCIAVKSIEKGSCKGCFFLNENTGACTVRSRIACARGIRKDMENVIFIEKETPVFSNKQNKISDKENKIVQILAEEINGGCLGYRLLEYGELRPIAKRIIKEIENES